MNTRVLSARPRAPEQGPTIKLNWQMAAVLMTALLQTAGVVWLVSGLSSRVEGLEARTHPLETGDLQREVGSIDTRTQDLQGDVKGMKRELNQILILSGGRPAERAAIAAQ